MDGLATDYFGKLSSSYRSTSSTGGESTSSLANVAEVGATGHVWEPWFGNWRAVGSFSRVETSAETDAANDVLAGELEVNLFHRSRFPFGAYVRVRDTRVEIEDLSESLNDLRIVNAGLLQQYQDPENGAFYLVSLDHDQQENLQTGDRSATDRLLLTVDRRGEVHGVNAVASLERASTSIGDGRISSGQLSLSHSYAPDRSLSVTSSAAMSFFDGKSFALEADSESWSLGTQATWYPDAEERLRIAGDVQLNHDEATLEGSPDQFRDAYRVRGSARYEASEQTSVFAEIGMDRQETAGSDRQSDFQALSASHTARARELAGLDYTWTASAGLARQAVEGADSDISATVGIGHAVSRAFVPQFSGPLPIVVSAGQDLAVLETSGETTEYRLSHRLSVGANRPVPETGANAYAQLSAFDVRTNGDTSSRVTSLNASVNFNQPLSRYRSVDLFSAYGYVDTASDGSGRRSDSLALEVRYRDTRLFDVYRLSLQSRVRASADSLLAEGDRDGRLDLEWDNRIDYRIGLLEFNARFGITQRDSDRNTLLMLTLTRRF